MRDRCAVLILGVNAYHGDASAALLADGEVVAAVEEERLTRIKHDCGLPVQATAMVLDVAGASFADVAHVAVSRNLHAHGPRRVVHGVGHLLRSRQSAGTALTSRGRIKDVAKDLADALGTTTGAPSFHQIEHHPSHLASAFFASDFDDAAICSVDGMGDQVSMAWGTGTGTSMQIDGRVFFPDSLGYFYTAITQLLGFPHYGDEYKVMGLAPYGEPRYLAEMRRLIKRRGRGFQLDRACFRPGRHPFTWRMDGGAPEVGPLYTPALEELLGPQRAKDEPVTDRHRDIAASAQVRLEEILVPMLTDLRTATGRPKLAMAGGVALNVTANTRIAAECGFQEVFIHPAAGDAGTSIGAALHVAPETLGHPRRYRMTDAYLGPSFTSEACETALVAAGLEPRRLGEDALCKETAALLAEGRIVGWFQGRMEFGPRALGNRSILCDPRDPTMKDTLNARTKRREGFRPFAPSVLAERAADVYELAGAASPFMLFAPSVRPEWRDRLPAVTHVDGTGRIQTVHRETNPRYWALLRAFEEQTGVPVLLNTSFNENEPIVCTPDEAIACFLRADMDVLVLEDLLVEAR